MLKMIGSLAGADDNAVLDFPESGGAFPTGQVFAVKKRNESVVATSER